jgi:hypothetical protein
MAGVTAKKLIATDHLVEIFMYCLTYSRNYSSQFSAEMWLKGRAAWPIFPPFPRQNLHPNPDPVTIEQVCPSVRGFDQTFGFH